MQWTDEQLSIFHARAIAVTLRLDAVLSRLEREREERNRRNAMRAKAWCNGMRREREVGERYSEVMLRNVTAAGHFKRERILRLLDRSTRNHILWRLSL